MTVWVWPDEKKRIAKFLFSAPPPVTPLVEINGTWQPMSVDGKVGSIILCGSAVNPPTTGAIVISEDVLPRVDVDGEIFTDEWIKVRTGAGL